MRVAETLVDLIFFARRDRDEDIPLHRATRVELMGEIAAGRVAHAELMDEIAAGRITHAEFMGEIAAGRVAPALPSLRVIARPRGGWGECGGRLGSTPPWGFMVRAVRR
jgi:hypothetical protein